MKYNILLSIGLSNDQNEEDAADWILSTLLIANPKLQRLEQHPYKPKIVKITKQSGKQL